MKRQEIQTLTKHAFHTRIGIKDFKLQKQYIRRECIRLKEEARKIKSQFNADTKAAEASLPTVWRDTTWDEWKERMKEMSQKAIYTGTINPSNPAYWGIKSFDNWQSPVKD